ncbi:Hypothetical protein SSCIU_00927 [Mammaliicoccus sciuri]|nr:Hypothetical protein SSCIU_00927 [Mammaliicoccus sciuri]
MKVFNDFASTWDIEDSRK